MPIIFEQITADLTPPALTSSASERQSDSSGSPKVDAKSLAREMQRAAERAERLSAD
jgi:hypothetical protein